MTLACVAWFVTMSLVAGYTAAVDCNGYTAPACIPGFEILFGIACGPFAAAWIYRECMRPIEQAQVLIRLGVVVGLFAGAATVWTAGMFISRPVVCGGRATGELCPYGLPTGIGLFVAVGVGVVWLGRRLAPATPMPPPPSPLAKPIDG